MEIITIILFFAALYLFYFLEDTGEICKTDEEESKNLDNWLDAGGALTDWLIKNLDKHGIRHMRVQRLIRGELEAWGRLKKYKYYDEKHVNFLRSLLTE